MFNLLYTALPESCQKTVTVLPSRLFFNLMTAITKDQPNQVVNLKKELKKHLTFYGNLIVIPLHWLSHWAVAIMIGDERHNKTLYVLDSLGTASPIALKLVEHFKEVVESLNFRVQGPKLVKCGDVGSKQQNNSFECGDFTVTNVDKVFSHLAMNREVNKEFFEKLQLKDVPVLPGLRAYLTTMVLDKLQNGGVAIQKNYEDMAKLLRTQYWSHRRKSRAI
jgi:Ulp1 family protease